jgi:hypothetical protein
MKFGRMLCVSLVGVLLTGGLRSLAQDKDKNAEAVQRADEAWLTLVDSAKFAESWKEAAAAFHAAVSEEKWVSAMQEFRVPLGKLQTRKLKSASYTRTLPGVPDGEYEVLIFESSFEHKQAAAETVISSVEKDGVWRVAGYYIK